MSRAVLNAILNEMQAWLKGNKKEQPYQKRDKS
jgi:hypothetical protein